MRFGTIGRRSGATSEPAAAADTLADELAAAVEAGIGRMLELLEDEVIRCLGLLGVTSLAELDKSYLHAATATTTRPAPTSCASPEHASTTSRY